MSHIRHEGPGASRQPSPAIWNRFPVDRLEALGLGTYFHDEFLGNFDTSTTAPTGWEISQDTDTVVATSNDLGGKLDFETDGDDNDAVAIFKRPFAKTVLDSGQPWAFEVALELGDVAMDGGVFVGLAEAAALTLDVVADDAGDVTTESLVGFQIMADDPDAVDAIYRLDAGTTVEVASDVTSSAQITSQGGTAASITNDTLFKIGMVFDGRETLTVYANGYRVAAATLDTTTFPDGVDMGLIIALKTGAAAAESIAVDWARAAYEERR